MAEPNPLDSAEIQEESIVKQEESVDDEVIPAFDSPEWHEYVMKQFQPDEIVEGNPTTEGLRRVVGILLGDIIESSARSVSYPNAENGYGATVEHTVVINWKNSDGYGGGDIRRFTEIADVNVRNCDNVFLQYASATASTRAEGRALRKALKLKHVIASEEINQTPPELQTNEAAPISATQITIIKSMCQRNKIDVNKFINIGSTKYDSIEEVPYEKAIKMIGHLNEYTNNKDKIPSNIKLKG